MTANRESRETEFGLRRSPAPLTAELPPPVADGARVGVAALSGPVDPEALERGLCALRELGFEPVAAANLERRSGLFAGGDDERLDAFHRLVSDDTLQAIFFARGGHGVLRLLDRIDWPLLARRPRAYIGYSDLTPLLNEIPRRLGLVAFHGPMVAADLARGLDQRERLSLLAALRGEYPARIPVSTNSAAEEAEGPLVGGCLSLLAATVGTAYAVEARDALLFWEDVAEPAYRLDRMLTHLRLSGRLAGVRGMVVGHGLECFSADDPLWKSLRDLALELRCPLATHCSSGHGAPNLTLPLGLRARLRGAAGELVFG